MWRSSLLIPTKPFLRCLQNHRLIQQTGTPVYWHRQKFFSINFLLIVDVSKSVTASTYNPDALVGYEAVNVWHSGLVSSEKELDCMWRYQRFPDLSIRFLPSLLSVDDVRVFVTLDMTKSRVTNKTGFYLYTVWSRRYVLSESVCLEYWLYQVDKLVIFITIFCDQGEGSCSG